MPVRRQRDSMSNTSIPASGPPHWTIPFYGDAQEISHLPLSGSNSHQVSRDARSSEATLAGLGPSESNVDRVSFSSYNHPFEIRPPQPGYTGAPTTQTLRSALRRRVSFAQDGIYATNPDEEVNDDQERAQKRRGIPSQMLELYALNKEIQEEEQQRNQSNISDNYSSPHAFQRPRVNRMDSMASMGSDDVDPDDPRVTGKRAKHLEGNDELSMEAMRTLDYRARRKHLMRAKIEYNVSCELNSPEEKGATNKYPLLAMVNRQEFLLKLARALMTFGAPSHRIESQLTAAARILEVESEFIHLPGVIICSFGDQELGCSETHFVKAGGRLSLGALHKVHFCYRAVVHDEISAKQATDTLEKLLTAPPMYSVITRCLLSFILSWLICPLAFGGSFVDMWVAGLGAFFLAVLQLTATKSALYANVFEYIYCYID